MRYRRRYIAFEVSGRRDKSEIYREITRRCGDVGGGIRVVVYDGSSRRGILLCGHSQLGGVKKAISGLGWIRVLGVSGTIRGARRKFL